MTCCCCCCNWVAGVPLVSVEPSIVSTALGSAAVQAAAVGLALQLVITLGTRVEQPGAFGLVEQALNAGNTDVQPAAVGLAVQEDTWVEQPAAAGLAVQDAVGGTAAEQPGAVGLAVQLLTAASTAEQPAVL